MSLTDVLKDIALILLKGLTLLFLFYKKLSTMIS